MAAGSDVTLTIDYSGQLVTSEGGPLPDKRLAYVGPDGAYLHYASRWFPFREYGADRATMELKLTMPDVLGARGAWRAVRPGAADSRDADTNDLPCADDRTTRAPTGHGGGQASSAGVGSRTAKSERPDADDRRDVTGPSGDDRGRAVPRRSGPVVHEHER